MTETYPVEYRAGGIVRRVHNDIAQYLLVTSNSNRDHWIIPAGHVEEGETPEQAALREVMEEAGVLAQIKLDLGNYRYTWLRDQQRITIDTHLYMMEYLETSIINPEGREVCFFSFDEIETLITWEESKEFLKKAHQLEIK